jgi:hypothetical protein
MQLWDDCDNNYIRADGRFGTISQSWWGIWYDLQACESFKDSKFLTSMLDPDERQKVCVKAVLEIQGLFDEILSGSAKIW